MARTNATHRRSLARQREREAQRAAMTSISSVTMQRSQEDPNKEHTAGSKLNQQAGNLTRASANVKPNHELPSSQDIPSPSVEGSSPDDTMLAPTASKDACVQEDNAQPGK